VKKNLWKILTLLWASIIVYFSFFTPYDPEEGVGFFEHQDKVGHLIFYAILTYGLIKVFRQEIILNEPLKLASSIGFVFGVIIELIQHYFTTLRVGSVMDALANGFGIILIVMLVHKYPKLFFIKP
jgi:VanZ family protein